MKKDIKVDKNNNTVTVKVTLEERVYASQPIQVVKHKEIEDMLRNEGFSLQKVLKYDRVDNENGDKITGEWIFQLENKQKAKEAKKKVSPSQNQTISTKKPQEKTTKSVVPPTPPKAKESTQRRIGK